MYIQEENNQIQRKLGLIKKAGISNFFECSMYSANVMNDILLGLDSENIEENIFIYGDFNGLGKINKEYGEDEGTRCLKNAIIEINEALPKDSVFYRIGGDEFLFTCKDENREINLEEKIKEINNRLLGIEGNRDLTIGLSGCDIREKNGLTVTEKLEKLKRNVEKAKIKRISEANRKNIQDKWNELRITIDNTMKKYIETFKLEEGYKIEGKNAEKRMHLMNEVVKLSLGKNKSRIYKGTQKEKIDRLSKAKNSKNTKKTRDKNQINNLYRCLTGKETKGIEEFDEEFLNEIGRSWFRNHVSGLYNKIYLEENLKSRFKDKVEEYEFILFSSVGIKVYNDTIGHDEADLMMKQCSETIDKYVKINIEKLNENENEQSVNRTNLIDIGAGDYILMNKKSNNKNNQISEKDIDDLEDRINSESHISVSVIKKDGNEYLKCADLDKFITMLRSDSLNKKARLKNDMINSEIAMEFFEKLINELSQKYKSTIDDYDSEENRKKWSHMNSLGILANICEIKEAELESSKKNNIDYEKNNEEEIR